jgi:hypothetical protein
MTTRSSAAASSIATTNIVDRATTTTTAASTPSPGYTAALNAYHQANPTSVESNASSGIGVECIGVSDSIDNNNRHYLGHVGKVPMIELPDFESLERVLYTLGLNLQQISRFISGYRQNCEVITMLVIGGNIDQSEVDDAIIF